MTRENYNKIKPFINAWEKRIEICIANADKTRLINMDINPLVHDQKEINLWVINDKYVEFRLALMRGETVESISGPLREWHRLQDPEPTRMFGASVSQYRVHKVDTSWVKEGAFARCHGWSAKPLEINIKKNGEIHFNNEISWDNKDEFVKECVKWEPKEGELCYFWNNGHLPQLNRYSGIIIKENKKAYIIENDLIFSNCIPYVGKEFWKD